METEEYRLIEVSGMTTKSELQTAMNNAAQEGFVYDGRIDRPGAGPFVVMTKRVIPGARS